MMKVLKYKKSKGLDFVRSNHFFLLSIAAGAIFGAALIAFGVVALQLNSVMGNPPAFGSIVAGAMVYLMGIIYISDHSQQRAALIAPTREVD